MRSPTAEVEAGAVEGGGRGRRELAATLAALAAFYLLGGLYLRPIWRNWWTRLAPSEGDPLFNLYLLKWVAHEAGRGFAGFWSPPFFYPAPGVLAYSDHLVGPGLLAAGWNAVVPGWIGTYNLLFLSSFAWTGWTLSWVLRRSGRSWPAAILGGALYAFCPFRWDQISHLQMLMMAAIPLTLWTFDRLLARPSWGRAAAFLLVYAAQLSGGCYLAAMIHFPLAVLAGNRLPRIRQDLREKRFAALAVLAATGALAVGLLAATFYEYRQVGARDGLAWGAGAERHYGASLLSYLQPSDSNLYSALWPRLLYRSENCLFPGFVAIALCALCALCMTGGRLARSDLPFEAGRPSRWRLAPLALALVGWAGADLLTWGENPRFAALGRWVPGDSYRLPFLLFVSGVALWAVLHRWLAGRWPWARIAALDPWPRGVLLAGVATALLSTPLFYLPLSHAIPALASMRVPARFQAFTMLSVAFFAAAGLDALAARLRGAGGPRARRRAALLTAVALGAVLLECAPRTLPWGRVPDEKDFPRVYFWIAGQPQVHALLELPLTDEAPEAGGLASIQAMYFGTLHWRPVVNGYSAHAPLAYQHLEATCCYPLPDPGTLAALRGAGVSHLLVHRSRLRHWERRELEGWESSALSRCELVYADERDRVYRLR